MNNLLVRCSVKGVSDASVRWGVQSAKSVALLPCATKMGSLHKMDWAEVQKLAEMSVSLDDVKFHPLFDDRPDKIVAIGLNYRDHCEEQNIVVERLPKDPIIFNKFPSTIVTHKSEVIHPSITDSLDYEAELAIIIGESGSRIPESEALHHVFGYTVANDITARDWQKNKNGKQWILGKSMNTFCPLGPGICKSDLITDPHNLEIKCEVNGQLRQKSNTSNLIHKIPTIIAYVSTFIRLQVGDVILTGTPGGVGMYMNPPGFLKPGDTVKCSIEGIGDLENTIVAEETS